ncbi:MAG TPA: 30S ribosome-binding factor RbfA [Polyangiaceae bacterium]|jgi:ribosome-binding factor A
MAAERGTRPLRVAEAVRKELASLLSGDVKDPGAQGTVVTAVEMSPDLRSARVRVKLLEGGGEEARRSAALAALGRASGMLRREVTQRLGLRFAPELRFVYEDGKDGATRVEEILAEIEADRRRSK